MNTFDRFKIYHKVIDWLHSKLNAQQFIIFSSILVGLTAGLGAVALKMAVHYLQVFLSDASITGKYTMIAFPFIGIGLSALFIRYINHKKLGKGIANIIHSIARRSSLLPRDQMYSHIVTSAVTVGFGGSAGLESPIVTTGAAIGSNYSRTYKMNYKERTLLLACGAAAGIAGAFDTPIAGVLFVMEVILIETGISSFIPLIIASATGALCSKIILHGDVLLFFKLKQAFNYQNVPFYIILGLLAGLVSVMYARIFHKTEQFFLKYKEAGLLKWFVGCSILGVLILFFPALYGEGYAGIKALAEQNIQKVFSTGILGEHSTLLGILVLSVAILFLKPIAVACTIGAGGNGGNFAPSLFMGAFLGFAFSTVLRELGICDLPVSNFTIVAMAGILSGIFHAPLTGIFLIAEITGGYELIIPLMIVSALSYAISKYFMPLNLDMKKLAEKDKIITTDTDSFILSKIDLKGMIENDFIPVQQTATLGDLVKIISSSNRNIYPVLDKDNHLRGIVQLDMIRELIFKQEMYEKLKVKELMRKPLAIIDENDTPHSIMKKFDASQLWNLPVVRHGEYIGFISKSGMLEQYREDLLKHIYT
ncbi:MAG: chloride channel protein [Bacteroidetes bacterium]|nr:chloride channel protein [Bacteroidota bacterium]